MATDVTDTPTNQCRHVVARGYLLTTRPSNGTKTGTFYPHTLGHLFFSTGTTPPCFVLFFNCQALGVKGVENKT